MLKCSVNLGRITVKNVFQLKLALSTSVLALCALPASAQTLPVDAKAAGQSEVASSTAAEPKPTPTIDDTKSADIVVTGSARPQRRFDVSYAVNSLSQSAIQKLAPKSLTDLVGSLPGVHVEQSGGEVQNITRVRGVPTDRGYLYYQQDGLPLYHDIDGFFFNQGDGMNRIDLMTSQIEFVRGGPAPIYASTAAAVANIITVNGSKTPRGEAQVTVGTTGLYRLDLMQSGPLSENTYFAIGGFIRQNKGYRDSGFPADRGGQIRANLKHDFANGFVKVSAQYVNDRNIFYLSIPTADPRNTSVSLNKYIDIFNGTLDTPALRAVNIKYRDSDGTIKGLNRDLADGRHMRFWNGALDYEGDFGDWHVSAKGGYTQGRSSFDALYSTTNPVDGASYAASFLPAAQAAFGAGVSRIGYAFTSTNGLGSYDPNSASGLVIQAQYRAVESKFYSGQGDLSITRKFDTGIGTHDIRVGLYAAKWGLDAFNIYQNYLFELQSKPRTLDLVAYSSTGSVLGYVTDNGALRDAVSLGAAKADGSMISVYGTDTWDLTDKLRIDLGIRHEWYSDTGFARVTGSANLGNPATLADDATRTFTGAIQNSTFKPKATNWTVGVNYDLNEHFGAYARASQLEVPPILTTAFAIPIPSLASTKARLFEAGVKASFGRSYLYVTAFYTKFSPLNASFTGFDPATGRADVATRFVGTAQNKGVEADGLLRVAGPLSLAGSITLQDPKYLNFTSATGIDGSRANGKQIQREPKLFLNVRPSLDFKAGASSVSIYGRYDYVTRRYVDFFNQTALPAYGYFGLGAMLTHGGWQLQVAGDNITNARGLTEGNTAGDRLAGQGTAEAIFGRPIFGRSFRVILGRKW